MAQYLQTRLAMANMSSNAEEQRILITQATEGMVLSRPVASGGVALCGVDTRLNDALIQRLMLRGIKRLHVQGHPVPSRQSVAIEEQIRDLRNRFNRVSHLPHMARLQRAIEQELLRYA